MTGQELPPLDDDIRELLVGARGTTPAPPGAAARVLAGVEAIVMTPPGGGGGSPHGAPSLPSQLGLLRRLLPLAATLALGGAVGAGAMHAATPSPAPIILPTPPVVVLLAPPPSPSPAPSLAPSPTPSLTPSLTPAPSSVSPPDALAAERSLLDVARHALEREDGAAALAATRDHERRFPAGQLVQEREAMAIRALLLLGRRGEARARTERFRAHFAGSVLLPSLEAAVAAPPPSP